MEEQVKTGVSFEIKVQAASQGQDGGRGRCWRWTMPLDRVGFIPKWSRLFYLLRDWGALGRSWTDIRNALLSSMAHPLLQAVRSVESLSWSVG